MPYQKANLIEHQTINLITPSQKECPSNNEYDACLYPGDVLQIKTNDLALYQDQSNLDK